MSGDRRMTKPMDNLFHDSIFCSGGRKLPFYAGVRETIYSSYRFSLIKPRFIKDFALLM